MSCETKQCQEIHEQCWKNPIQPMMFTYFLYMEYSQNLRFTERSATKWVCPLSFCIVLWSSIWDSFQYRFFCEFPILLHALVQWEWWNVYLHEREYWTNLTYMPLLLLLWGLFLFHIWGAVKIYYNCLVCFWRVVVFWGGPYRFTGFCCFRHHPSRS